MEESDGAIHKADLGILLVHGIGQQKQGETLISFGEPLKQWLSAWLRGADDDLGSDKVLVLETNIQSQGTRRPSCSRFRLDTGGEQREWLIAESWWADSFPPPKYTDLLRWAAVVLPLAVTSHFSRRLRLASGSQNSRPEKWFQILLTALQAIMFVMVLPVLGLGLVLVLALGALPIPKLRGWLLAGRSTFLGTIGDSYLFVSSALRGSSMATRLLADLKWLKRRCRSTVVIAHSQGAAVAHAAFQTAASTDSSAPADAFITFGAGIRKLKELEMARPRRIVGAWALSLLLIALSAQVWQVIAWMLSDPPSGLALARMLGATSEQFIPGIDTRNFLGIDLLAAWWVLPLLMGLAFGLGQGLVASFSQKGRRWWSGISAVATFSMLYTALGIAVAASILATGLLYLLVLTLGLASLMLLAGRPPDPDRAMPLPKGMAWFDFHAKADPVPNGPLLGRDDPAVVESNEVENLDSALFDHTTYWSNREQFVAAIAARVSRISDPKTQLLQGEDELFLERARDRRGWRMRWLRVGRVLALAAIAIPAFAWSDLLFPSGTEPSTFSRLALDLIGQLNSLPFVNIETQKISVSMLNRLGWALFIPLVLGLLALTTAMWRWWDEADNTTLCRREAYTLLPPAFLGVVLLLIAYLSISALILPYWDVIQATIASDPTVVAIIARQRGEPIVVENFGIVGAIPFAIGAAALSAWTFATLNKRWRGPSRDLQAPIIVFFASLPVTIAALFASITLSPFWVALIVVVVGSLLGVLYFALSLGYRRIPASWAVRIAALTGAGPLGLWLLAKKHSDESLRAYADARCIELVNKRTLKARIKQKNPDYEAQPEPCSLGDELEQILLIRSAFANGTQADSSWLRYALVFPDAGIEFALRIQGTNAEAALDVLAKHEAHPVRRIRHAVKRAQAAIAANSHSHSTQSVPPGP